MIRKSFCAGVLTLALLIPALAADFTLSPAIKARGPWPQYTTTASSAVDAISDAPEDQNYNRLVKLPYPASAEHMWRGDHLYDLVAVLGYNDDPVVPGKGSAIFMHLAKPDYASTQGCVALAQDDLLAAIEQLRPGDQVPRLPGHRASFTSV